LHTQRPSWLYKCKFHHQIKSKGDSTFPKKPSPPRGLLRGVLPPKNGPIFRKKKPISNTLSTTRPEPRANPRGARAARRKRRASRG
jgi:hypothetical protein